jgi:hypothetical protein
MNFPVMHARDRYSHKEPDMTTNTWWGKTLRFIGILFMALTGGFTLLGGSGRPAPPLPGEI